MHKIKIIIKKNFKEKKKKKKKNDVIECLDFVKVTGEICSW